MSQEHRGSEMLPALLKVTELATWAVGLWSWVVWLQNLTYTYRVDADSGHGASGVLSMNSINSGVCRPRKAQVFGCRAFSSYTWLGPPAVIRMSFRVQPFLQSPGGLICRSRPQTWANSCYLQEEKPSCSSLQPPSPWSAAEALVSDVSGSLPHIF